VTDGMAVTARRGGPGRSKMYTTTGFTIIHSIYVCCYARGRCTRGVRESFVRDLGERRAGGPAIGSRRTIRRRRRRSVFTHLPGPSGADAGQYEHSVERSNVVVACTHTHAHIRQHTPTRAPRRLPRHCVNV